MCRNITPLRGLEPPATEDEIVAAAQQYVRKVAAMGKPTSVTQEAFDKAVAAVAAATHELLTDMPPRKQPPLIDPPLRRRTAVASAVAGTS